MARVKINASVLETYANQAFKETCFLLGREFTRVISTPGIFPDFPGQDIVDENLLRTSQQLEFIRPGEARFSWPVDYALYVHEGYTLQNGTVVPGRPWTQEAIAGFNVESTFNRLLEAKLKNG